MLLIFIIIVLFMTLLIYVDAVISHFVLAGMFPPRKQVLSMLRLAEIAQRVLLPYFDNICAQARNLILCMYTSTTRCSSTASVEDTMFPLPAVIGLFLALQ